MIAAQEAKEVVEAKEVQEMTGVQEVEERESLGRRKNMVVGTIKAKGKFTSLVINAGTVNKFNPKTLLSLINQYLPDQEAQIGKIDIQFSHTVFDVDENYQEQVINAFKKAKYKGTTLVVDKLKGKKKAE